MPPPSVSEQTSIDWPTRPALPAIRATFPQSRRTICAPPHFRRKVCFPRPAPPPLWHWPAPPPSSASPSPSSAFHAGRFPIAHHSTALSALRSPESACPASPFLPLRSVPPKLAACGRALIRRPFPPALHNPDRSAPAWSAPPATARSSPPVQILRAMRPALPAAISPALPRFPPAPTARARYL